MTISHLNLKEFRNFNEGHLSFRNRFQIFVGPNAQGKTNILESLYLLSIGKSFRVSDFRDLIRWNSDAGHIKAFIKTNVGEEVREAVLTRDKKHFLKNGKPASPNQFNSMPLVLFAPEEILLLRSSPGARRDFIDNLFTKLSPIYGDNLRRYHLALSHRNKLLKKNELDSVSREEQVRFWESPLLEHGDILWKERFRLLTFLNPILERHYRVIAGTEFKSARFDYCPNNDTFDLRRADELIRGFTLVGPHRDEIIPSLNADPIAHAGSQGEMRSFTLALKLTEIELFENILKKTPILLLDDVMSELDENRSRFFFDYLKTFRGQVFATATALHLFPKNARAGAEVWSVENGTVRAF